MKKFLKLFLFSFYMGFFLLSVNAKAESMTARALILDDGANVRKSPSVASSRITSVNKGSIYSLVENKLVADTNNHDGCSTDWYQIYYNGADTGYICGEHVKVVESYSTDGVAPSTACETEMQTLGFPSSYWGGLCYLKEIHPNWQFYPLQTNLDWKTSVEEESVCGKSYIQTNSEDYMDRTCNNYYGWNSSWKNASQKAVAYYMDPRNFLSERFIFQFEYLRYSESLSNYYPSSVDGILKNANFYTYHKALNNDLSLILNTIGTEVNISPTFVAARILQEMGNSNTLFDLYSGIYAGFEDYYNFYNFGVSDSCATSKGPALCGLEYAKSRDWKGLSNALKGGASSISSTYIDKGQYTRYLQKFNVVPSNPDAKYTHQYMTGLAAPMSESSSTFKSYESLGILNQIFAFYIPVYQNMNETIVNSGSGATNDTPTDNPNDIPINTIITSSGYKYQTGFISGIPLGTDVATLKGTIESVSGKSIAVFDAKGNSIQSGVIGTGFKIQVANSTTQEVLEVIIKGDTSGDGVINALDLLQVQKNILGVYTLNGAQAQAADTSGDGIINALDLLQVQKNILGISNITQ